MSGISDSRARFIQIIADRLIDERTIKTYTNKVETLSTRFVNGSRCWTRVSEMIVTMDLINNEI